MDVTREHPEYEKSREVWQQYRDLYAGGEQFKANATQYLIQRQREAAPVYYERLSRVFYENYIGSIVDWYTATLFRREPVITFEGAEGARSDRRAARVPADARTAGVPRSDRPAAHAGAGGSVRQRHRAGRVAAPDRVAPRVAALRGALGPPLARRRPLRRLERLRARLRSP